MNDPKITFTAGTEELLRKLDTPNPGKIGKYGSLVSQFPLPEAEWWHSNSDEGPYSLGGPTAYDAFESAVDEIDDVEGAFYLVHANHWTHSKAAHHAGGWLLERMREYVCDNSDREYAEDYFEKIERDAELSKKFDEYIQNAVVSFMDEHKISEPRAFNETRRSTLVRYHIHNPDAEDEEIYIDSVAAEGWNIEDVQPKPE